MTVTSTYKSSLTCMPVIQNNLYAVAVAIQALTTSPAGEVVKKCQDVWVKIQSADVVIESTTHQLELQISLYNRNLAFQEKFRADLHAQIRTEKINRDDLTAKKSELIGVKACLEGRKNSLESECRSLKKKQNKKKGAAAAVATFGILTGVAAVVTAPFTGGLSLLALGVTAGSGIGVTSLALDIERIGKLIKNTANEIRSVERSIQYYDTQIREKSKLISDLEATLRDVESKIRSSSLETQLLGRGVTAVKNDCVTLKNIHNRYKSLQEDIEFIQDAIQDGLKGNEIKKLVGDYFSKDLFHSIVSGSANCSAPSLT